MKKIIYIFLISLFIITGCKEKEIEKNDFKIISAEEAYKMMNKEENKDLIILDVRNIEEYNESRIDGSINIPLMQIEDKIENTISNKDSIILVYCKSGVRAKLASEKLINLGYTNVYDFGGIDNWSYGLVNLTE